MNYNIAVQEFCNYTDIYVAATELSEYQVCIYCQVMFITTAESIKSFVHRFSNIANIWSV